MRVVFVIILFFTVTSNANSIFKRLKPPLVAAHQGGYPWQSGNNSIPKFNQAINHNTDIIETDIRLTKDNVVVVFHDDILDDDTNCTGVIREKFFSEIMFCRYDRSGTYILKFEDALLLVNGRVIINAEFKVQEVVIPAIRLIQKYDAYDWVYFQTKAERNRYALARRTDPKVALLYKAVNVVELDWAISLNDPYLVVIEMEADMATSKNIQKVTQANKLVSVNSWRYGYFEEYFSAACNKVFNLGVGIAVTNNISSCKAQIGSFILK